MTSFHDVIGDPETRRPQKPINRRLISRLDSFLFWRAKGADLSIAQHSFSSWRAKGADLSIAQHSFLFWRSKGEDLSPAVYWFE